MNHLAATTQYSASEHDYLKHYSGEPMLSVQQVIDLSQQRFGELLRTALKQGPISLEQYVRYLSMQYHLTRGVQRYFMLAAAHSDLNKFKKLRKFLLDFAIVEELHYVVAAHDLHKLGRMPLPEPYDVHLWHRYFEKVVVTRPFVRLGAACILENISAGAARAYVKQALTAPFLTKENTKFLELHQHETLPHGNQLLEALSSASLNETQMNDLLEGARKGLVSYLRMAEWALDSECLAAMADSHLMSISASEQREIEQFDMEILDS